MTEALTWIVPGRRAVVRSGGIGYTQLIAAWLDNLRAHRNAIEYWYDTPAEGYDDGLMEVEDFAFVVFNDWTDTPVAREDDNVIDSFGARFWVRLWKGPLRILLEQQDYAGEVGDRVLEVTSTIEPALDLDEESGQVLNPSARFCMGDVVEFPLFKFLAAAGCTEYGNGPAYDDVLAFNPAGSFLLGDSVLDTYGQPSSLPLHDNRIAMRFQGLLNTYIGAFHSLAPVFSNSGVGPQGHSNGHSVYARGMLYAATLTRPSIEGHWRVRDYHWCGNKQGQIPKCLPTRSGLNGLSSDFPVTPGSVCSDTALFLLNYMMHNHTDNWGGGSVRNTMLNKGEAALHDAYEHVAATDLSHLVPELTVEEMEAALVGLVEALQPLVDELNVKGRYLAEAVATHRAHADWDELRSSRRDSLDKNSSSNKPVAFMQSVASGLKSSKTTTAGRALLGRLHRDVIARTITIRDELRKVFGGEDWGKCAYIESKQTERCIQRLKALDPLVMCDTGCRDKHKDPFYTGVYQFRASLKAKYKGLRKIYDLPPEERRRKLSKKLGGARIASVELSEFMTDINVVSLGGHEWCVVRLAPFADLCQSGSLPVAGFMSGYHPLTGEPFGRPGGAFHVFEETGTLKRITISDDEKYRLLGAGPFKWERIDGDRCTLQVSGKTLHIGEGARLRNQQFKGLTRIRLSDGLAHIRARHEAQTPSRPLFVHPVDGTNPKEDTKLAKKRLVDNGNTLYALRSVPLPTIREVEGAFASAKDTKGELDRLESRLRQVRKTAGSSLRTKIDAFLEHL
ncbi:MAG: hypothetical protein AAF799_01920 [Myxococcota bacterium]